MRSVQALAAAAAIIGFVGVAHAQPFAEAKTSRSGYSGGAIAPKSACDALATAKLDELVEIKATAVAAAGDVPAYCRVSGVLQPEVAFEVNLPATWNGRFYMIGNGGHAGEALDGPGRTAQRDQALSHGFVMAGTNTGHDASKEPGGTFVLSNPQKAIDYAYRAVHVTATTAKEIARRYYGQAVAHSYWNSCSNGGRQGLLEAQRYPDDFDGIVANAPWVDQTGFTIGAMWNQRALAETPVSAEKIALVANAVMAKCDAVDGLKDGLIDDPRRCSFEVASDVASLPRRHRRRHVPHVRAGRRDPEGLRRPDRPGKHCFPGFMVGSEALAAGPNGTTNSVWANLILPPARPTRSPRTSTWPKARCATSCSSRRSPTTTTRSSTSIATRRCSSAGARSRTPPTRT